MTTLAAAGDKFVWKNLVSDLDGVASEVDANLNDSWGVIPGQEGETIWVANAGSGTVTRYDLDGVPFQLNLGTKKTPDFGTQVVTIPLSNVGTGNPGTGGAPTGIVLNHAAFGTNNSQEFLLGGKPSHWLAVTEDGGIVGYNTSNATTFTSSALLGANTVGAFYTGCTLAFTGGTGTAAHRLYAANFAAGTVDVFNSDFSPATDLVVNAFVDPAAVTGYKPYNVKRYATKDPVTKHILRVILVAYAQNDGLNRGVAGDGNGYVDVFGTDGSFKGRLVAQGAATAGRNLNVPWGMAIFRKNAKQADDVLLVANHGSGAILAYSLANVFTGSFTAQTSSKEVLQRADGEGALLFSQLRAVHFGVKHETAKLFALDEDELDDGDGSLFISADLVDNEHGLIGRIFGAP